LGDELKALVEHPGFKFAFPPLAYSTAAIIKQPCLKPRRVIPGAFVTWTWLISSILYHCRGYPSRKSCGSGGDGK